MGGIYRSADWWGEVEEDLWIEEVTVRGVEVGGGLVGG